MRKLWYALFLIPQLSWGNFEDPQKKGEEEALFLRRIAAFWEEGEYHLAKSQMEEFLEAFPDSSFAPPLCAALGDLFLKEKNYSQALNFYSKIQDPKIEAAIFLNRMQCLYYLEWYATLADECEAMLEQGEQDQERRLQTTYYLAIALYNQCLNAEKSPEILQKLAERARPYFEILLGSQLDTEVAQAFAHLSCILKDYSKASSIYLELAKKEGELNEEMAFQAALIQAEFDRDLALQTFGKIANIGKKREKEAVYNQIVLLFELGRFEKLIEQKETLLKRIPPEKEASAQLFFARAFLILKQFPEACLQFKKCIHEFQSVQTQVSVLASLIDAASQGNDLASLDWGLEKLTTLDSTSPEIPKALLSRALLLKKLGNIDEARMQLEKIVIQFPHFSSNMQASFELLHLDFQAKNWEKCREECMAFLKNYPESDWALFAGRYLIFTLTQLSLENPTSLSFKNTLIEEIPQLISSLPSLSLAEKQDWEFLIAKCKFELGAIEEAKNILEGLLQSKTSFSQQANASLLLALCIRDKNKDLSSFVQLAQQAIQSGCDLIPIGTLHSSLFNAFLELSEEQQNPEYLKQAANHLWLAFESQAEIQIENLHWLADYYISEGDKEGKKDLHRKATSLLVRCISLCNSTSDDILNKETYLYKLAHLYANNGQIPESLYLVEKLMEYYRNEPTSPWKWEKQAALLQGENYATLGNKEKAIQLLDSIVQEKSALRTPVGSSASLASARIKKSLGQIDTVMTQLKDLSIQKTLTNEPTHLEAALDYLDIVMQDQNKSAERRLFLLKRTKENFENESDLLSKDYHAARLRFPEKDQIYQAYMKFLSAEILFMQSSFTETFEEQQQLLANAKDLYRQIIDEKTSPLPLVERARRRAVNKDYGVPSEHEK